MSEIEAETTEHDPRCCVTAHGADHKCDPAAFCRRCEACKLDAMRYAEASSYFAPMGQYRRCFRKREPMTAKPTAPDLIAEVEALLAKATPPCDCGSKHCNGKTELNGLRFVCASEYGMDTTEYHIDDPEAALYEAAPDLLRRLVEEIKRLREGFKNASGLHRVKDEFWNSAETELEEVRACDKCALCEDHHG